MVRTTLSQSVSHAVSPSFDPIFSLTTTPRAVSNAMLKCTKDGSAPPAVNTITEYSLTRATQFR
jgi:protoheme ferro-lyase